MTYNECSRNIYSGGKEELQNVLFRIAYEDARKFDDTEELEDLKRVYPERFAECERRYNHGTL